MINKIAHHLRKAHRFNLQPLYKRDIKRWRASFLHQTIITNNKPHVLAIAHAQMIDQALKNKEEFQKVSEAIRFDFFDIWQDMEYAKRNEFLLLNMTSFYENACVMDFENEQILVPFFDPLLNALMMKRPAVFDLPQYFKLYKDYKGNCVDPLKTYGLSLLHSPFYPFTHLHSLNHEHVFYDAQHHALIHCEGIAFKEVYALYEPIDDATILKELSLALLNHDLVEFTRLGVHHQLFHPNLLNKCDKALRKRKKGA